MEAAEVIREVRHVTGLTQRALATAAGTTQSAIAAYESGVKQPTTGTLDRIVRAAGVELSWAVVRRTQYRPMSLTDLAGEMRDASDDLNRRLLSLEFIQEFEAEPPSTQATLLAARPPSTGSARWDALLGALAEHLAFHHDLICPPWACESDRFLDQWWFPTSTPLRRAAAMVNAPASLARRGVFIERRDLERV